MVFRNKHRCGQTSVGAEGADVGTESRLGHPLDRLMNTSWLCSQLRALENFRGPSERVGRVRRRKVDSVGFQHIPFIRWMVTSLLESGLPIESGPKARAQCCALIM